MKRSDLIFKLLIYLSLVFLLFFLWRFDYLSLKEIDLNIFWLIGSLILLWLGFILSTISWKYALRFHNIHINNGKAIISHGLSVFAKYIPGKIWVILGRASYVSRDNISLKETSFISLKEQLLYILLGLFISAIPSLYYFRLNYISIILVVTSIVLALVLFNNKFHDLTERLMGRLLRKEFDLPRLKVSLSVKLSFYILLYWLTWTLAFYFLNKAILPEANLINAFAFPLSVCYGVLAIFLPGGLGVREGLMVAFLIAVGMQPEEAVTLSIVARLWFITGEVFLFMLAFILRNAGEATTIRPK